MRLSRRGTASIILIAAALAFVGGAMRARSAVVVGGPFALVAANGEAATDLTYRGKWLLVYFGYTSCPDSCPTALVEIGRTLAALGDDAVKLQPVFITVDPRRDTVETMQNYLKSFDPRIVGLTGTKEQVQAVAREYGVYLIARKTGPGPDQYAVDHSSYLYLMDPEGRFVRGFDAEASANEITAALRPLISQPRESAQTGIAAPKGP